MIALVAVMSGIPLSGLIIGLRKFRRNATALEHEVALRTRDLEMMRKAADAANISKSEFLANMSHEIRTPMTAILGYASLLVEHGDLEKEPPERVEAVTTIQRNGEYLLGIINNILDLSKIEAGMMTIECSVCRPCAIVAEVASLMRVRADAKGLTLNIEYIRTIPETIQSDSTRLRQILLNLVGNAIKFTEVGGVSLVTRWVAHGAESWLQFDVIDTGAGVSEKARLFQPFMQSDSSSTRKAGGTGLGLTISKSFAQLLGGDVTMVATETGVGSIFRVRLPTGPLDGVRMLDDPMSATVVGKVARASQVARSGLQGCRILLAEDGPDNQRLISFVLEKAGADVRVEKNGQRALDAALAAGSEGKPFDVILMDMQMPVMDGYEAALRLFSKGCDTPIIALTAHAMSGDREKCLASGCADYASKPIDRAKLIALVQTYFKRRC